MPPRKKEPDALPGQAEIDRSPEQNKLALRRKVFFFYDIQRLRLQTGGRVDRAPENDNVQLHEVDKAILERRMAELETAEKHALADVAEHLSTIPFYAQILSDKVAYRGIGPTMAGVIVASFDIARSDTVSKMWAFAGLRPMPCKRCKHCQSVVEEIPGTHPDTTWRHRRASPAKNSKARIEPGKPIEGAQGAQGAEDRDVKIKKCPKAGAMLNADDVFDSGHAQHPVKGEKLPYNAWLRMKLVGVLAPVLLKVGSPWKKYYDDYKHRKASAGWGRSDAHRHQAAMRYMVKMLLLDVYVKWRTLEGLPVRVPYAAEYLGRPHHESVARPSIAEGAPVSLEDAQIDAELAALGDSGSPISDDEGEIEP